MPFERPSPAWSVFDLRSVARSPSRGTRATSSLGWRRAQDGLVAFQVAISLTLLVAAGLLGRSFWNLRNAEIGFEPRGAISFTLRSTSGRAYATTVCESPASCTSMRSIRSGRVPRFATCSSYTRAMRPAARTGVGAAGTLSITAVDCGATPG
jgi:hypothetical protein